MITIKELFYQGLSKVRDYFNKIIKIIFYLNQWLKKWHSLLLLITIIIPSIAMAVSVYLFWLNNNNIKKNTIKYLRDINVSNLKHAKGIIEDLKNENEIIEYKIINTEEIITLKAVRFWNDFEIDVYILNFDHITKNYNKNIAEAYITAIVKMKAVNNVNNDIGGLWIDRYKFSLNNRNEIKVAIARSQEDLYNWSQDVCNSLSVIIISNQHKFQSILNKDDLSIIKEICESNLCGENLRKAIGGDCNKIYNSDIPFVIKN